MNNNSKSNNNDNVKRGYEAGVQRECQSGEREREMWKNETIHPLWAP